MDQTFLVTKGQRLIELLDLTLAKPQAAMWVHYPDSDVWKLWIVPDSAVQDKREFYRIVAEVISDQETLAGLDVSATEFIREDHPAIRGMQRVLRMPGVGDAHFTGNTFNGYYLPDGIVIRMDVARKNPAAA
ncbi:hypothetical protein [Nitratireductor luteus]|uniref:hypothetical protein n=1 Tax=Nitratireductor luteus TaxID=2976980 RepID=UPI00223FB8BB|nr:hypothetical protein [Nitratireductor luteus]